MDKPVSEPTSLEQAFSSLDHYLSQPKVFMRAESQEAKDAARYRWLRDADVESNWLKIIENTPSWQWDAAIDKEIENAKT